MSSRRRKRDSTEKRSFTSSLKRLPLGIISSFILPYLNDCDVKNACQTEIIEIQQYAYRTALWHIDEVTAINGPYIQRVKGVTDLHKIKHMNKLMELHFMNEFNEPLQGNDKSLLPDGLRTLYFGDYFNHTFKDITQRGRSLLPDTLQTLFFGWDFNHPLHMEGKSLLPDSLLLLRLGLGFTQELSVGGISIIPHGCIVADY